MDIKWIRGLREVSLLADEALANRILEAERLKTAELRLQLIEREGRHMCITPGCRKPVVGRQLFEHCEQHLKPWEQRWLDEDVESPDWRPKPKDESEHPAVSGMKDIVRAKDEKLVKEIAARKEKALADANDLLERAYGLESERSAYLPHKLRLRMAENQSIAEKEVSKPERTEEQKEATHRAVVEDLSKQGGVITSSRQTASGHWVHEVSFPQGGATIFSAVPDPGQPKDR